MQRAIDEAWNNPHKTPEQAAFRRQIAPDGKVPTPVEVIRYLGNKRRGNG